MALPVQFSVLLAFALAALPVHAGLYKWVDEDGSVTYSNTPPPEPGKVTDVVRIEAPPPPPKQAEPAVLAPAPGIAKPEPAGSRPDAARRNAEVAKPDDAAPTAPAASGPAAVQDPCLKSPDPQCHQRNKDNYHPYLGYAPGAARPAVGATGARAGGAVGRQVIEPPAVKPAQPAAPASTPAISVKTK